jgi:hypothetical protein
VLASYQVPYCYAYSVQRTAREPGCQGPCQGAISEGGIPDSSGTLPGTATLPSPAITTGVPVVALPDRAAHPGRDACPAGCAVVNVPMLGFLLDGCAEPKA